MNFSGKRVSIHWVKAILAAAESLGIPSDRILGALKLRLDLENNQPSYLSLDQTQSIWAKAEELSGHPFFGLNMGPRVRPSYFNVVSYVAMTSDNLATAYSSFVRYMPLVSEAGEMDLYHEGSDFWIRFIPRPDETPFSRHQIESVISMVLNFSRWLIGDDKLKPSAVCFCHASPRELSEYQKVLGVIPKFDQNFSGLKFPREILSRSLIESDNALNALHKTHAEQLLSVHLNNSWAAKVIKVIMEAGHFSMSREEVAEKLNISTRTLQRRLQEEGTSFLDVMDGQRKQKAEDLICRSQKSLKEVALDLGFSEPSTFYRACHRWFDSTPNVMREQALKE